MSQQALKTLKHRILASGRPLADRQEARVPSSPRSARAEFLQSYVG